MQEIGEILLLKVINDEKNINYSYRNIYHEYRLRSC